MLIHCISHDINQKLLSFLDIDQLMFCNYLDYEKFYKEIVDIFTTFEDN